MKWIPLLMLFFYFSHVSPHTWYLPFLFFSLSYDVTWIPFGSLCLSFRDLLQMVLTVQVEELLQRNSYIAAWTDGWAPGAGGVLALEAQERTVHLCFPADQKGWSITPLTPGSFKSYLLKGKHLLHEGCLPRRAVLQLETLAEWGNFSLCMFLGIPDNALPSIAEKILSAVLLLPRTNNW